MNFRHPTRHPAFVLGLAALLLGSVLLAGCGTDSTGPDPNAATAPTLPNPEGLKVDLGFFTQAGKSLDVNSPDKFGRANFTNAYLRAVIVGAMTDLVLTPPVAAFALALHTTPNHQPDGSWIWIYTFVNGAEEAQVRLRGELMGDEVAWQMRVTAHDAHHDLNQALWFDGTTRNDGADGQWTFYDLDQPAAPAAAELEWHHATSAHELTLRALLGDDAGDALTFSVQGPESRIDYTDASTSAAWYLRWNAIDGTGSLRVPEYNGGLEACWDAQQYDVDCGN